MFKVQPVRSQELQEEISKLFGVEYHKNTYSFFAADMDDECTVITDILGLCQFEFSPECASIVSIAAAPGHVDDEAIFIMVRTVMNFCYRAEIPIIKIIFSPEAVSSCELLKDSSYAVKLGFREKSNYEINLKDFYKSPCHYKND